MISVAEADKIISENIISLETEIIPSLDANGRLLKEKIQADRDFPPFHRVMMDGIAIRFADWQKGQRRFRIQATQLAGVAAIPLLEGAYAIEIMTGAVCPPGADVIVRVEDISIEEEAGIKYAQIQEVGIKPGQNIHPQGLDRKSGDLLLSEGVRLGLAELAVAVSVGKTALSVSRLPRIAVISTGDELVEIHEKPLSYQIRRSNVYALQAALGSRNISADLFHFLDNKSEISQEMEKILREYDVIILSGGVSKGKADFVPLVMEEQGVKKLFHRVKQRPGKPFWLGRKDQTMVFALPGNPVSTVACFHRYVLPYLQKIMGLASEEVLFAQLSQDHAFPPDLSLFLSVRVSSRKNGILEARPVPGHGSGDFANLIEADGFLELPPGQDLYPAGATYRLHMFRPLQF